MALSLQQCLGLQCPGDPHADPGVCPVLNSLPAPSLPSSQSQLCVLGPHEHQDCLTMPALVAQHNSPSPPLPQALLLCSQGLKTLNSEPQSPRPIATPMLPLPGSGPSPPGSIPSDSVGHIWTSSVNSDERGRGSHGRFIYHHHEKLSSSTMRGGGLGGGRLPQPSGRRLIPAHWDCWA